MVFNRQRIWRIGLDLCPIVWSAEMGDIVVHEKCFISCLSAGKWMDPEHQEMKGEEHNIMKVGN